MKKTLLLLLLATTALANPTFTEIPEYPTGEVTAGISTNLRQACGRFVRGITATGFTKLAGRVTASYGAGKKITFTIYGDGDGLPQLATTGPLDASVAATVSQTGLSLDLSSGVVYRVCVCTTGNAGGYDAPNWNLNAFPALQNAFVPSNGYSTNPCDSSGNAPSTTGALVADVTLKPPLLHASSE